MKRRFLAGLLSAAMILTMTTVTPVGAAPEDSEEAGAKSAAVLSDEELGTNIAPKATAGASYTNVGNLLRHPLIPAGTAGAAETKRTQ